MDSRSEWAEIIKLIKEYSANAAVQDGEHLLESTKDFNKSQHSRAR